jgi:predicted nucleotidyltransferase
MFGLSEKDIDYIKQAVKKFDEIDKAIIFGSRALGNYKKGSDVDIAIVGKKVSKNTITQLSEYLNEIYPLPYFFDIVNYNEISNKELKKHIDRVGIVIDSL